MGVVDRILSEHEDIIATAVAAQVISVVPAKASRVPAGRHRDEHRI